MIRFRDWLAANESSPFTRSRAQAALGLGPDIPLASLNSRSTAPPWIHDKLTKKKKKKKKKDKDDDDDKKFEEGKAQTPNYSFDDIIKKIMDVQKLSDELKSKRAKDQDKKDKEDKDKKPEEKDIKNKPEDKKKSSEEMDEPKENPVDKPEPKEKRDVDPKKPIFGNTDKNNPFAKKANLEKSKKPDKP
jgi:hypothetical protein